MCDLSIAWTKETKQTNDVNSGKLLSKMKLKYIFFIDFLSVLMQINKFSDLSEMLMYGSYDEETV